MADYEYILACLMIPIAYVMIYIAGKYDIITLFLDILAERLEAYNRKQDEERHNGWIPCSELLPKYGHTFKVWLSFTTPFTSFSKAAWWVESHFEWDNGKAVKEKPIAWMQYNVPAPYIPKQEEQKGIEK